MGSMETQNTCTFLHAYTTQPIELLIRANSGSLFVLYKHYPPGLGLTFFRPVKPCNMPPNQNVYYKSSI